MQRISLLTSLFVFIIVNCAHSFETLATSAFMIEQSTGSVLMSKNATSPIPPASMSKLMTINMLFEALQDGRTKLDTKFIVSKHAASIKGSTMFLRQGERVSVDNLLRGIIVQSGNDACVVVAEALEGSEAVFAQKMTQRAAELGMTSSRFANSTGWPHNDQRMSAKDLVFIANRLITEFPQYYSYFSEKSFTWDNVVQKNRNPLLSLDIGADGLKTGHTQEAGYGLVGSVKQNDQRIIFMISGLESKSDRTTEAERLTNWAFSQFTKRNLADKNVEIARADVWLGKESSVGLISRTPISTMLLRGSEDETKYEISYNRPITAPITTENSIATLIVTSKGRAPQEYPLYAEKNIAKGGIFTRMTTAANRIKAAITGKKIFSTNE